METQVRTPQAVFTQPQRLVVPLFQRPYVWNEENQWEPLWNDVIRVAERVLRQPSEKHHPHFLGAVVLQQLQKQTGQLQERTIIDGQQRLTTLQLLLHALCAELQSIAAIKPAKRIEGLVVNEEHFCSKPEDRFKVWPTNRDRNAFNAVMNTKPSGDDEAITHPGEKIAAAHRYFRTQAREWLSLDGPDATEKRAFAIDTVVRELLQMVIIDLGVDEDAQEIFETLNARGAQLTAADLIKNFIFQRLLETGKDVDDAYQRNWKEFETGFWETEVPVGRLRYPRSAIFLNHWLIARTGEEVVAREVFYRFKRFVDDSGVSMTDLLEQVHLAAGIYRDFVTAASTLTGPIKRLGLFGYRTGVLESEVVKPLILCLLDPQESVIPDIQLNKALDVVESWMVRRMLVRATTKAYNKVMSELVNLIRKSDRAIAGDVLEKYLASQSAESSYWPDDVEVKRGLSELQAYHRLRRGRLRMVLEALEDHMRGWKNGKEALSGERVARSKLAIEHIMPRKWLTHWPLEDGHSEEDRDSIIHTLGNLTLLTSKLNSKVSNGPWSNGGKRAALHAHDTLFLNREVVNFEEWTDDAIKARTEELARAITEIWLVPPNHRSQISHERPRARKKVYLSDLMVGGVLTPGMSLFPRYKKYSHRVATLLPDGTVELDGIPYSSPSDAAKSITGNQTNGWAFFLTDQESKLSLRRVRNDYRDKMAVDAEDDDQEEDEEDDEDE